MSEASTRHALISADRSFVLGSVWLILAAGLVIAQIASVPTIEISWKTASEYDTAGFNVYRSSRYDQGFIRMNETLIHGEAGTATGAEYIFIDDDVVRGTTYYYRLEDVEYDNSSTQHETISGKADYFETWAILLVGICVFVAISFLAHGIRSRRSTAN